MTREPDAPISVAEADVIARRLSNNKMAVQDMGDGIYLTHVGERGRLHLLPYQLTVQGIELAVQGNDPWTK